MKKNVNNKNVKAKNNTKEKKKVNPKLKKTINQISIVTVFLLGLISFYLIFRILMLNMIPMKYFMIILVLILLMLGIISLLLINKKIKWKIKVGGIIFSFIMMVIMFFAAKYITNTIDFLNKITKNNYEIETYYLMTLKENNIDNLSDINTPIGYVPTLGNINEAIDELNKDNDFKYEEYEQIINLKDDLLNEEIEVVLMADYHKDLIQDDDETFEEKVKIIHTISIKKEKKQESEKVDVKRQPFNIYISGIDTYGEIGKVSRSDVNIIVSVNPNTKQILLTTIPRDYYVTLHGYGQKDKLTHAGVFGIQTSIGTLEDLLNTNINYYVRVNFSTLENVVDVLGGIDVYSETDTFTGRGETFVKGYNHLNGKQALIFARERYAFMDGDRQRGKNQQAVIKAIINKAISPAIISNYSSLLKSLNGTFQTNMSASEIQSLAKFQIDKMPSWEILTMSLNGSDAYNTTYLSGSTKLYVMVPDQESVEYAKEKISSLLSDEKIEVKEESVSSIYKPSSGSSSKPSSKPKEEDKIENDDNNGVVENDNSNNADTPNTDSSNDVTSNESDDTPNVEDSNNDSETPNNVESSDNSDSSSNIEEMPNDAIINDIE